jgi:hypothetical protein
MAYETSLVDQEITQDGFLQPTSNLMPEVSDHACFSVGEWRNQMPAF